MWQLEIIYCSNCIYATVRIFTILCWYDNSEIIYCTKLYIIVRIFTALYWRDNSEIFITQLYISVWESLLHYALYISVRIIIALYWYDNSEIIYFSTLYITVRILNALCWYDNSEIFIIELYILVWESLLHYIDMSIRKYLLLNCIYQCENLYCTMLIWQFKNIYYWTLYISVRIFTALCWYVNSEIFITELYISVWESLLHYVDMTIQKYLLLNFIY